MDVFVPSTTGGRLYRNVGSGKFTDITAQAGDLARPFGRGSAAVWTNLEGGAAPGLLVGCLKGVNRYFRPAAGGKFVDATEEIGLHQKVFNTRGVCAADINGDNLPDLLLNNEDQESTALLGAERPRVAAK